MFADPCSGMAHGASCKGNASLQHLIAPQPGSRTHPGFGALYASWAVNI